SRLIPNCFAFACSHSELLIIWCCVAAFGWNSEEPVRAAAWRLACAARTQLKAYPGGGEDGGKEQRRRLGSLSRPACRGRGDAQLEERDDHK
ncbi:Hypothetical predicted protein, partial [Scomber scombrus]